MPSFFHCQQYTAAGSRTTPVVGVLSAFKVTVLLNKVRSSIAVILLQCLCQPRTSIFTCVRGRLEKPFVDYHSTIDHSTYTYVLITMAADSFSSVLSGGRTRKDDINLTDSPFLEPEIHYAHASRMKSSHDDGCFFFLSCLAVLKMHIHCVRIKHNRQSKRTNWNDVIDSDTICVILRHNSFCSSQGHIVRCKKFGWEVYFKLTDKAY